MVSWGISLYYFLTVDFSFCSSSISLILMISYFSFLFLSSSSLMYFTLQSAHTYFMSSESFSFSFRFLRFVLGVSSISLCLINKIIQSIIFHQLLQPLPPHLAVLHPELRIVDNLIILSVKAPTQCSLSYYKMGNHSDFIEFLSVFKQHLFDTLSPSSHR